MKKVYNENGLMFWTEVDILNRNHFIELFKTEVVRILAEDNEAWATRVHRIEAPVLIPNSMISSNYTEDDFYKVDDAISLRPETTNSSYEYARYLLKHKSHTLPPFIIWQAGKSFRREQDHVTKHMRLKEFYQQEFQCFYTADTFNNYQTSIMNRLQDVFAKALGVKTRLLTSDRLPSYSKLTLDVEALVGDYWMEVCSVSVRTDFTDKILIDIPNKSKVIEKEMLVLEIAIGLDRCVYIKGEA